MCTLSPKTIRTLETEFTNVIPDEGQIVRLEDSNEIGKYKEYIYTNDTWLYKTFNFFDKTTEAMDVLDVLDVEKTDNAEKTENGLSIETVFPPVGLQDVIDVLMSTPCHVHVAIKLLNQMISMPIEKTKSKTRKRLKKSIAADIDGIPIPIARKRSLFNVFMSDTLASLDRTIPYKDRMATAVEMYKQFKAEGK